MTKRLFTYVFSLILLTAQAQAAVGSEALKKIFRDFNYAVNVEWDQKDPAFVEGQKEVLRSELRKLQAAGMGQKEILDYAISQIKNKELARQISASVNLANAGALSESEAADLILKATEGSTSVGASWSSDSEGAIALLVTVGVLAAIVTLVLIFQGKKCPEENRVYEDVWQCYEIRDCHYTGPANTPNPCVTCSWVPNYTCNIDPNA